MFEIIGQFVILGANIRDISSGKRVVFFVMFFRILYINVLKEKKCKKNIYLQLYCGFYKHDVEEHLTDAELMFEAMGYCYSGNSTMSITDVLDPDRIISVSRDAILACVECQVLKQIWESLTPYYNITWLEILEFRENHTGTADQAIRTLRYKRRQRQYEEQMYRRAQYQVAESHSRPEYAYGSNLSYFNHMHYPGHSYQYPVQSRFGSVNAPHIVSPSSIYPPMYGSQSAIKPQDFYPPNGYHVHPHYSPMQDHYPNFHPAHAQQPTVPTAQLIELDSSPVQNNDRQKYPEEEIVSRWQEEKNESSFPSGKAKDDGAGSWENWDNLYRNLGSQGYKKSGSSRADVTSPKSNRNSDSEGKDQGELIEKIRKMNVGVTSTAKEAKDIDEEPKVRSRKETTKEPESSRGSGSTPEKRVSSPAKVSDDQRESDSESDSNGKWQCIACTYLNSSDKVICEVCSKSKERGAESEPQPTGGQECQKCTLVNERGLNFCAACDKPLKGAPTYI